MSNNNYIIDNPDFSYGNLFAGSDHIDYQYTTGITVAATNTYTINPATAMSSTVMITSENQSGVIDCKGENADILLNGRSVRDTLAAIEDRLGILRPNEQLESEWDELKELARQYRKLEAELKEKQRVWDILKKSGDNGHG